MSLTYNLHDYVKRNYTIDVYKQHKKSKWYIVQKVCVLIFLLYNGNIFNLILRVEKFFDYFLIFPFSIDSFRIVSKKHDNINVVGIKNNQLP